MPENTNEFIAGIYVEYKERLRRMAECMIHNYYDSYDVVEDTFLHLYIHAEWLIKLTEPMKKRYIYSSCRRICDRYISENSAVYTVGLEEDEPDEDTQDMLDAVIEREALRKCLNELHPGYRRIFTLRYLENLGYDEIAGMENVSRESVIKSVSRIRQKLRVIFRDKCR